MIIGGRGSDNYPTNAVEVYAPGRSCGAALPPLTDPLFHPFATLVTAQGILPATVLTCGTLYPNIACYTFVTNGAGWTKIPNLSVYYHPYFVAFRWLNRVYVIDDLHPESLDLSVSPYSWSSDPTVNVPRLYGNYTNGGGCVVVLNGVLYMFGGKASTAIKTIQLTNPNANWAWNFVSNLPANTGVLGCAPIPNNKGLVMISLDQSSVTQVVIYDIASNTVKSTASTADLYGADLLEACHDRSLYAIVLGQSVQSYPATNESGTNSNWQAVTTGSTPINYRYFATSLTVPR
jgi:hypothetical protein